jgi:phage terminase small subunit
VTPAQRAALDVLPERRRRFVLAYVGEAAGNATQAARTAGYAKPAEEGCRLLKNAQIGEALSLMRMPSLERAYRNVEELREWWSEMMGADIEPKDRIKASELLGKSQGAFVERTEVSGPSGTPIEIVAAEHARIVDLARGSGSE